MSENQRVFQKMLQNKDISRALDEYFRPSQIPNKWKEISIEPCLDFILKSLKKTIANQQMGRRVGIESLGDGENYQNCLDLGRIGKTVIWEKYLFFVKTSFTRSSPKGISV